MHPITKAIRLQANRTDEMEHSVPLFLTSSFCFDNAEEMRAAFADESDDNIYSRFSNPNVAEFTNKMVALEGAEAGYATASGMSAVFGSFMAILKKGDHLYKVCQCLFYLLLFLILIAIIRAVNYKGDILNLCRVVK